MDRGGRRLDDGSPLLWMCDVMIIYFGFVHRQGRRRRRYVGGHCCQRSGSLNFYPSLLCLAMEPSQSYCAAHGLVPPPLLAYCGRTVLHIQTNEYKNDTHRGCYRKKGAKVFLSEGGLLLDLSRRAEIVSVF